LSIIILIHLLPIPANKLACFVGETANQVERFGCHFRQRHKADGNEQFRLSFFRRIGFRPDGFENETPVSFLSFQNRKKK
jgi:hypothetical protein